MVLLPWTTDDVLFSFLSPGDLARFSMASRGSHAAIVSYYGRAFRIDTLLASFFEPLEIVYFRYWQARVGLLLSGSTALQFFNRILYPGSDLDLYVEHRYCLPIAKWLQSIGYQYLPRRWQNDSVDVEVEETPIGPTYSGPGRFFYPSESTGYFGRGVASVINFHKVNPDRKIQLITSYHSPLEVILNFHSTCVMNVISHEKAYSLYPRATFEEHRSLMYSTEGTNQESARQKYVSRGWTMVKTISSKEVRNTSSALKPGRRFIGDKDCWTMELVPKLEIPSEINLVKNFLESNTWGLFYTRNLEAKMDFRVLLASSLQFSYTVVDEELCHYLAPALFHYAELPLLLRALCADTDIHFLVKSYNSLKKHLPPTLELDPDILDQEECTMETPIPRSLTEILMSCLRGGPLEATLVNTVVFL